MGLDFSRELILDHAADCITSIERFIDVRASDSIGIRAYYARQSLNHSKIMPHKDAVRNGIFILKS